MAVVTVLTPRMAIAQEKSCGGEDRNWNVAATAAVFL